MSDNIIRFPGLRGNPNPDDPRQPEPPQLQPAPRPPGARPTLSAEQDKAVQLAASGMPFIIVAIRPTNNGADFFTAIHGDATDLRNAHTHVPEIIERALRKRGIIT